MMCFQISKLFAFWFQARTFAPIQTYDKHYEIHSRPNDHILNKLGKEPLGDATLSNVV